MALPRHSSQLEREMVSPLEELKELLKRTSRVEGALSRMEVAVPLATDTSLRPPPDTYAYSPVAKRAAGPCQHERDYVQYDDERTPPPLSERPLNTKLAENRKVTIPTTSRSRKANSGFSDATSRLAQSKSIPRTPLALSLAKMREAEEQWLKEKAHLRRDADTQRKRACGLEHRYNQLQALYKHQGSELKALKAALRQRDFNMDQLEVKLREAHEDAARSEQYANEQLNTLKDERRELQQLLNAALAQLQDPKRASSQGCVDEQEAELGETKERAMDAEARLAHAQEKMDWQAKLMERLLDVQLAHNRGKADAIEQALSGEDQAATD